jgi:two-component system, OmpR family, response regulator
MTLQGLVENAAASIVIVEDDAVIRELVAELLRKEGFRAIAVADAPSMDAALKDARPDLMILDLMLPGEDGVSICRRLRERERFFILMLTAKGDEIDRVVGLEMGADDYLVKPFSPRELVARVRAILRRGSGSRFADPPERRFTFDSFSIDLDARRLSDQNNVLIPLTAAEFDLLRCFVERPRRVLTRDQLFNWTRGRTPSPLDRTLDMLISRLRRKLDGVSQTGNLIVTVRNGGYLLTAHVNRAP